MGFFDFITQPVHRIIGSLGKPINEAEHALGQAFEVTVEIVKSLLDMVREIENLFSASKLEQLFVEPFKIAIANALDSIEKLLALITSAGQPAVGDMKQELTLATDEVYDVVRRAVKDMVGLIHDLINDIKADDAKFIGAIHRELTLLKSLSHGMVRTVESIKNKMVHAIEVKATNAFVMAKKEFTSVSARVGIISQDKSSITTKGQHKISPFSSITANVKKRLENEHAAADAMILLTIAMILGSLVGIYYITRSMPLMIIVGIIMLLSMAMIYINDG